MARHSLDFQPFPSVEPSAVPDAKAHVSTSPEMFGGSIGQAQEGLGKALEHAGAQAFDTAKFYDQVASDDGYNQFVEGANKIGYGDPTASVSGPDGKPMPDTGYFGMKGAAALSGRKDAEDRLDKLAKDISSGLDPMARKNFDTSVRRYRTHMAERFAAHADTQANTYYSSVNKATSDANLNTISLSPTDDKAVALATDNLINARVKQVQLQGGGQEQIDEAIRGAKADALKVRVLTISAGDPLAAKKLIEANRETAGTEFEPLFRHVEHRADQQQGIGVANEVMAKTRANRAAAPDSGAAAVLRHYEGLKTNAYWDVNHWRVGYGSDTVTRADGRVEPVTAMTQVTREDAERDLARRVRETQLSIQAKVGASAWDNLDAGTRAALTSTAYNYGRLPDNIAAAVRSGDKAQIAAAIRSRAEDNNGQNFKRRHEEAGLLSGQSAFGVGGENYPAQGVQMASLSGTLSDASKSTKPSLENPTLAPEQPPTLTKTDAYNEIMARSDLSQQAKDYAVQHLNQMYSMQQAADVQEERTRRIVSDRAADAVMTAIGHGVTPELVAQIYASPALDWRTKHQLVDIAQRAGTSEEAGLGSGYAQALKRIAAPDGTEDRITDLPALVDMVSHGEITHKGYSRLKEMLHDSRKSVETSGVNTARSAMLAYAKQKLVVDEALSIGGRQWKDDQGLLIYNGTFVPKFEAAYDSWIKAGKDPFQFLTQENVDKMVAPLRSRADLARAQLDAGAATGEAVQAPPPPPPANVDEKGWQEVVMKPPHRFSPKAWGGAVARLVADHSPEAMQEFDAHFGPMKAPPAAEILTSLGVKGAE